MLLIFDPPWLRLLGTADDQAWYNRLLINMMNIRVLHTHSSKQNVYSQGVEVHSRSVIILRIASQIYMYVNVIVLKATLW